MNRRPRRPLNEELADLEQQLASLTLRVAEIRSQINPGSTRLPRTPTIGDRVRFHIAGQGNVEGIIIGATEHRVRIRQDGSSHIILRAPHNVTVL
jgi:hypothetical protein